MYTDELFKHPLLSVCVWSHDVLLVYVGVASYEVMRGGVTVV